MTWHAHPTLTFRIVCREQEAGSPTDEHDPLKFWENVHGFNMTQLQHLMVPHAEVAVVSEAEICSDRCLFATIDAETITDEQLDFEASFVLVSWRLPCLSYFALLRVLCLKMADD